MPTSEPRNFDLNIEKILEGWEVKHAIREVIDEHQEGVEAWVPKLISSSLAKIK